jgi:hypothetical protein
VSDPGPSPDPVADPAADAADPVAEPVADPAADAADLADGPPRPTGSAQYKGGDLEPTRGPGLGCFWTQLVVLAFLIVLTPLTVTWGWPSAVSALLLFIVIGLLLIAGQSMMFLARVVAADRRGRRRPLASVTKTVGELEDAGAVAEPKADPPAPTDPPTAPEPL